MWLTYRLHTLARHYSTSILSQALSGIVVPLTVLCVSIRSRHYSVHDQSPVIWPWSRKLFYSSYCQRSLQNSVDDKTFLSANLTIFLLLLKYRLYPLQKQCFLIPNFPTVFNKNALIKRRILSLKRFTETVYCFICVLLIIVRHFRSRSQPKLTLPGKNWECFCKYSLRNNSYVLYWLCQECRRFPPLAAIKIVWDQPKIKDRIEILNLVKIIVVACFCVQFFDLLY